jgi:hypothetical protein
VFDGTIVQAWTRHHWAYVACGLWLLGFDVVPLAHMVFHESLDHHEHGHHHGAHHDRGHDHPDEDSDETPSEHGDGSVAHRQLAAQIPLASVPVVQEALLSWSAPAIRAHDERPADRQPRTTAARGPPAQTV